MKSLLALIATLAISSSAVAQTGGVWDSNLTAEQKVCVSDCLKDTAKPAPPPKPVVRKPVAKKPAKPAPKQPAIDVSQLATKTELGALERKLGEEANARKTADDRHDRAIGELQSNDKQQDRDISALKSAKQEAPRLELSPEVGVLALKSKDGTFYTGMPITVNLGVRLTERTWLNLGGGFALAGDKEGAVSALARGGIEYRFNSGLAIEGGISGNAVQLDRELLAKSIFIMGDVGVKYHVSRFYVGARLLSGLEVDGMKPLFGYGAGLVGGVNLL